MERVGGTQVVAVKLAVLRVAEKVEEEAGSWEDTREDLQVGG